METLETRTDGIIISLRKSDQRIELAFGGDCFVLGQDTANAIIVGLQACLTHVETLKTHTNVPYVHVDLVV
jgi:L-lysine 2,3-aminomutase